MKLQTSSAILPHFYSVLGLIFPSLHASYCHSLNSILILDQGEQGVIVPQLFKFWYLVYFTFSSVWEYAISSIILMRKFRVFILEYDFMFPERSQLFYLALWTAEEPSLPITWVKVSFKEQVCGEFQGWDLTGHSNYYSSLPFADCLAPTSSPSGTHTDISKSEAVPELGRWLSS